MQRSLGMRSLLTCNVIALDGTSLTPAAGYRITNMVGIDHNGALAPIGHILSLRTTHEVYLHCIRQVWKKLIELLKAGLISHLPHVRHMLIDGDLACTCDD